MCILRKVIALMRIKKPPILRLIAILLSVALLDASWSTPAKTTDRSLLAGQLLVSSPTIGDPRFDHTVILVVQHDQKGAFGIAINLPLEERPLASLLETLGAKDVTAAVRYASLPVDQSSLILASLSIAATIVNLKQSRLTAGQR